MSTNFEYQVKNKDTYKNTNKNTNNDIIPEIIKDKSEYINQEIIPEIIKDKSEYINQEIIEDKVQNINQVDSKEADELLHNVSKWNQKLSEFGTLYDEQKKIFIKKYKQLYKDTYDYNQLKEYAKNLQDDSLIDGLLSMYIGIDFQIVAWLLENKFINQINMIYTIIPFARGYMAGIKWLQENDLIDITDTQYMYVSGVSGQLDVAKYVYNNNGKKFYFIDSIFYMCCDDNKLDMVDWIINTHNYKPSPEIVQELIIRAQCQNNLEMINKLKKL